MDYRLNCAETDEQREKEKSFYGIGLTSRKNLCIHPEVRAFGTSASLHDLMQRRISLGIQRKEGEGRGCQMSRPH